MPLLRLRPAFVAAASFAIGVVLTLAAPAAAQNPYGGRAPNFYVQDLNTGQILAEQNADVPLPPASMSKLVTLEMLFEALDDGRVALDTQWTVSARAQAMGGSRMFLEQRHRPTTEDLIRGIAVLSGNDATVVVAEGLAGHEDAFAAQATERMRSLGLTQTTIANASGWPDPRHRMSLRDLGILAHHLLTEHAEYYHYLSERQFTWNEITQPNRAPLLNAGVGMDGLKTGHTDEAGYALTGSAIQGDRRIIFVFSGLASAAEREEEAERIINWAFRQFSENRIAEPGQVVAQADVWLGDRASVGLAPTGPVRVLAPVPSLGEVTARVEYTGPVQAPIAEGQELAQLVVNTPGVGESRYPLVAAEAVPEGGFSTRLRSAVLVLSNRLGFAQL